MPLSEFDIIRQYFSEVFVTDAPQVVCGVGDDCAVLALEPGEELATSVDAYIAGRHFPDDYPPRHLGPRCLAAAASDLAACGARPLGFTLVLTLPGADEAWLAGFSAGLAGAAARLALPLVGGDTVRGPLAVTFQVLGAVPAGEALLRSGAVVGDRVWVTGTLGDARAALDALDDPAEGNAVFLDRYNTPEPRLAFGQSLRGIASAAIDISDGLAADLGHILEAGGVGAEVHCTELPLSPALTERYDASTALAYALTGGDDYELCFTAPVARSADISAAADALGLPVACIGEIVGAPGLRCLDAEGNEVSLADTGYRHF